MFADAECYLQLLLSRVMSTFTNANFKYGLVRFCKVLIILECEMTFYSSTD